ncbi:MAG TPA: hypothetical protein VFZ61_10275 [Polyangiales bacterium]
MTDRVRRAWSPSSGWLASAALLLALVAAPRARADGTGSLPKELTPRVELSLTPNKGLMTGDVITLKLKVSAKPGVDVAVPEQSFAPFELIARKASEKELAGVREHEFELSLLALEPGAQTVPAVSLRVVGPKGELGEVKTTAQAVSIGSLIANEPNAEAKPPSKPVVVMQDDYTLAWIGGGILFTGLVALATLLISRWLKRRPKLAPPPPPPRPAWELAMAKLEALAQNKAAWMAENRGGEYVDGVSDALREYLGRRYGFDGLESTTDEILRMLERIRPHKLSLSSVSLLLEQCDLVKFARAAPDVEICDEVWNAAVTLVRTTVPTEPQTLAAQTAGTP